MIDRPFRESRPNRKSVQYRVQGAYLNRGVESAAVPEGTFYTLAGVDPRYLGGLRKWGAMKTVVNLASTWTNPAAGLGIIKRFRYVTFRKTGTGDMYRGFVVMYTATTDCQVSFIYSLNGSSWSELIIFQSGGAEEVNATQNLDVVVGDDRMLVLVEVELPKIIYYDTGASALVCLDAGAGVFADDGTGSPLPAMGSVAVDVASGYYLRGDETYQTRYRFYDSVRGIYSAMSDPYTITLNKKGMLNGQATITVGGTVAEEDHLLIGDGTTTRDYEFDTGDGLDDGGDVIIDVSSKGLINYSLDTGISVTDGAQISIQYADTAGSKDTYEAVEYKKAYCQFNNTTTKPTDGQTITIVSGAVTEVYEFDIAGDGVAGGNIEVPCTTAELTAASLPNTIWGVMQAWMAEVTAHSTIVTRSYVGITNGKKIYLTPVVAKTAVTFTTTVANTLIWGTASGSDIVSSSMRTPAGVTKLEYTEGATLATVMALMNLGTLANYDLTNNALTGVLEVTNNVAGEPIFIVVGSTFSAGNISSVDYIGEDSKEWVAGKIVTAINGDASAVVQARQEGVDVIVTSKDSSSTGKTYTLSVEGNGLTLSAPTFTTSGVPVGEPEVNCKATISFPNSADFAVGERYTQFGDPTTGLFDHVEVFRTIGLKGSGTEGAIFYLEQTLDMPITSDLWDALTVSLGTMMDEALPFAQQYDPETDVVKSIASGTDVGGYYQGSAFIGGTGVDRFKVFHSNINSESPEYFTTYNFRKSDAELGSMVKFVRAGDYFFGFRTGGILHIFKGGKNKPVQYTDVHTGLTPISRMAAHSIGNSVMVMTGEGTYLINAVDANLGLVSALDRVLTDGNWLHEVRDHSGWVDSGYDTDMKCSFFLLGKGASPHSAGNEMLVVCHKTQASCMLEYVPYVHMDYGMHYSSLDRVVAYFVTETGQVVMCDSSNQAGGNMGGLTGTLSGVVTNTGTSKTVMDASAATFSTAVVGHYLTFVSGNNGGESRMISARGSETQVTVSAAFTNNMVAGDKFVIGATPVKVRWWKPNASDMEIADDFRRVVVTGVAAKMRSISNGGTELAAWTGKHAYWRVGVVRNGVVQTWAQRADLLIDATGANPADMVVAVSADGVDVEPYMEHWSEGTMFELTGIEVMATMTGSRHIS